MIRKTITFLLFLIFLSTKSYSQASSSQRKAGINVSIVPHLMLQTITKLEVDKRIGNNCHWISASLWSGGINLFYAGPLEYSSYIRWGTELSYRYYAPFDVGPMNVYMQTGLAYNTTTVSVDGYGYVPTSYNGNEALIYADETWTDRMYQYGGQIKTGIVIHTNKVIFFDFYAGVAYMFAHIDREVASSNDYNEGFLGPAHEGFAPLAGVRFGLSF